ncbi:MAG TPA: sugar phosphate nucleotidyltransferase [Methanospirillum sp.]|nr:sugar phosphate nucleotidyltransferase [Methanospirillum sp.]
MSLQAVILAAGEGTRLRPLTQNKPKALLPVANRPILEHLVDTLMKCGIRDIIVVVGYRKEQVMRHLIRLPVEVKVAIQKEQIGTAHALLCARDLITGDVLVLPGDNYVDSASLKEVIKIQNSLLITTHKYPTNFGVVSVEEGFVTSIVEKPDRATRTTVNCGVYHLTSDLFRSIHSQTMIEAVTSFLNNNVKITAVVAHEWQDAIYPWDLLTMNQRLLRATARSKDGILSSGAVIEGQVSIGRGTVIGPYTIIQGPVVIGEDCVIGPHCVITPGSSIGSRVTLEPFTVITSSLIMDDCVIASHSSLTSAVLGEGCTLGEHTVVTAGSGFLEIGEEAVKSCCGVIMGNGVFSSPMITYENCIIGNDVVIDATNGLRLRSKVIPDRTRVM